MDERSRSRPSKRDHFEAHDVYDGTTPKRRRISRNTFRPARVGRLGHELMWRELQTVSRPSSSESVLSRRVLHFRRAVELDTIDPHEELFTTPSFLKKRSRVTEMVSVEGILFVLTHNGLCVAYDVDTGRKLCLLNIAADQVIRSFFFNKLTMSIMTVSVFRSDDFESLRCRTTHILAIRRGRPYNGDDLFQYETLKYPGFVEFDEINGIVVTASKKLNSYKIWDLRDYTLRYEIDDERIHDIKMCPGVLVLQYPLSRQHVLIKFLSSKDGTVQHKFNIMVKRGSRIEFIEPFHERLLIKQEKENVRIIDLRSMETVEVPDTRLVIPQSFIFLDKLNLFLTFRDREYSLYNVRGEQMATLQDHAYYGNFNMRHISVSQSQDHIWSYSRGQYPGRGIATLSHIPSGKIVTRLPALPDGRLDDDYPDGEDVTSITFDEARRQLIVGDALGRVFVWGQ